MDPAIARLEDLSRTDPVAAPLAILTAESLRASGARAWQAAAPILDSEKLRDGKPLLMGATITLDPAPARDLLGTLSVLACSGVSGISQKIGSIPDPLALLEAGINQDGDRLAALAADAGTDEGLLATFGQLLALPSLRACGEKAKPLLRGTTWDHGYCPVCAAWPTIAEVRGAERERWLRCGRCGSAWRRPHLTCVYCGNDDHETQGYLAPELSMESRRATTCDRCHGYLKSVATLMTLDPSDLLLTDLSTLELDAAALDRGYARPAIPGYALGTRVEPA